MCVFKRPCLHSVRLFLSITLFLGTFVNDSLKLQKIIHCKDGDFDKVELVKNSLSLM